jgi:hypothetical protein
MSGPARPTPFELGLGPAAGARLGPIRAALEAAGVDPADRDRFLLVREVAELLHALRPEEGLGADVAGLAAFLHHGYRFWLAGEPVRAVSPDELTRLLASRLPGAADPALAPPRGRYVQLPPLRVWGEPRPGSPPEPLDGWFVQGSVTGEPHLSILAAFGLHPGRPGLTVVEAEGARPGPLARADGSPLFAPRLPGGAALASLAGTEELLELAWRVEAE